MLTEMINANAAANRGAFVGVKPSGSRAARPSSGEVRMKTGDRVTATDETAADSTRLFPLFEAAGSDTGRVTNDAIANSSVVNGAVADSSVMNVNSTGGAAVHILQTAHPALEAISEAMELETLRYDAYLGETF